MSVAGTYGKSVLFALECFTSSELDPLNVYDSVLYKHQATIRLQYIYATPILYRGAVDVYRYTAWSLGVARCFDIV